MKYIHLKCLLHWLKSRTSNNPILSNSNENFNAYYMNQKTECELCKQLFPDYIKHNDIKYCLIDFDYSQENKIKENNNNPNYLNTNMENNNNVNININTNNNKNNTEENKFIVLDTVFPLTDNNKYRYIVKFNNNNEMKIGRGLDNQMILNEITVSRNHCLLNLQKNKNGKYEIKMEDQSSKFGSLILMQSNKFEIIKGKPLHIQISNVHLVIQYKKNNSLLSCCNVDVVDEKNSYEKNNNRAVKNKNVVNILTEVLSDDEGDTENDNNNMVEKKEKDKNNNGEMLKIKKKNDVEKGILLLDNNIYSNLDKQDKKNMNTIPKETHEKKETLEKKENKGAEKINENNNEVINDSVEVEEDNDKK